MATCLTDIQYITDDKNVLYIRKVSFAGTLAGRIFTKEIVYNYPNNAKQRNNINGSGSSSSIVDFNRLGNLNIQNCDKAIRQVLYQFKLVIVNSDVDAQLLKEYFVTGCDDESNENTPSIIIATSKAIIASFDCDNEYNSTDK